jgi:hypothetical protein
MDVEAKLKELDERLTKLEGRFKRSRPQKVMGAIDALKVDRKLVEILAPIAQDLQRDWIEVFLSVDWITTELKKAHAWCLANPQKAPKSAWARFYNSWLMRAWDRYRKTIPSNTSNEPEFDF